MDQHNPLDFEGEAEREEAAGRLTELEKVQEHADFEWLMGDERGRRFMWALLGAAGVYRTSFTGDNTTFYLEGRRSVGLELLLKLNTHCPDRYLAMIIERKPTDVS